MDKFTVEFYEKDNGESPIEEFLNHLDIKMRNKLLMIMKILQEKGNQLREPYSKHLDDGIFVVKKSQKTPKQEIELAKAYRKDYIERFGNSYENIRPILK